MSKLLPHKAAVFGSSTLAMIAAVLAMVLFSPEAASAQGTCIQDVWKAHGNNQNLTCTAGDVKLSAATNIQISSGGSCDASGCSCFAGQEVTFTADFRMDLTAETRYDVGFYLATDGDVALDGALLGQCSANASLATNTLNGKFINLDASDPKQAGDVCGEITDGPPSNNPLLVRATIVGANCPATPGQKMQLPFATTWRQSGANDVCTGIGNGTTGNGVYPGAPSKCNKGILTLDITSVDTTITVTKTALTDNVPESGGSATFGVKVKNDSAIAVTLQSLNDDKFGDITQVQGAVTVTNCATGGSIAAGQEYSCMFTATIPPGDFPGSHTDTVTGCANNATDPANKCDDDDATVPYTDVLQPPSLTKAVGSMLCQIDVTYNVVVTNGSSQDALTLSALVDDKYGSITSAHGANPGATPPIGEVVSTTCATPQTVAAGTSNTYSCSFVGRMTSCDQTLTDIVTGTATDDDGKAYTPTGTATVVVSTTP